MKNTWCSGICTCGIFVTCLHIVTVWRLHLFLIRHDNDGLHHKQEILKPVGKENFFKPVGKVRPKRKLPKELPDALRLDPSEVTIVPRDVKGGNCCPFWDSPPHKKEVECKGICFTPQACRETGNGFWPFRDEQEKESFARRKKRKADGNTADERREITRMVNETKQKCHIHEASLKKPPVRWNTTSAFPFPEIPPPGCSIVSAGGGSGAFQNLYVIPSAKLAFCGVPKAGITNWLHFIRFVMGAHDYRSTPWVKPDLLAWSFDLMLPDIQNRIWNDPEWTFAIFLRNPAERLLSAYLDKLKVARRSGSISKHLGYNESFTFEKFLENLDKENPGGINCKEGDPTHGINWCNDPHWRPQTWSCGMSEKIDRFDFIGRLDHVEEHAQALLERVGLWESHGKHFRNGLSKRTKGQDPCVQLFPLQDEFESIPLHSRQEGFQVKHSHTEVAKKGKTTKKQSWDTIGHARGASQKTEEYYSPEMYRKVEDKLYKSDYQVWNLLEKNDGKWVSGKDILPHLLDAQ